MSKYFIIFWLLQVFVASCGAHVYDNFQIQLQKKCNFTRYPTLCLQTMMEENEFPRLHVAYVLVNKTISETKLATSVFTSMSSQSDIKEAQHVQSIIDYCEELMKMSLKRLKQSQLAIKESPVKNKHHIQTWLSAVVTYQQACKDSATAVGGLSTSHISHKMDHLSQLTSNPLALINRITGKNKNSTKSRNLEEEKQDFPNWVSAKDRKLLQTTTVKANVVVAQDGTGNYKTVKEAIDAATGNRFVIYVKAGVYHEKISTNKDGITLIGDGKSSTIIVGDDSVGGGTSMKDTATFTITGDGFIARDIGFENTAGPQGKQALALYIASDHSVLYRCSIAGYQDTLYSLSLRQFYRECDIYGTIDFIFGNSAAVFQSSNLVLRHRRNGGYNAILANGRTDPGQNTGFSVQNCHIMPSSDFSSAKHSYPSYLGRPWKRYSRSVVMQSAIDDAISSEGWAEWPGQGSYSKTAYFAEYANTGPGGGISGRVKWPGFHVIGADDAVKFTVGSFISGNSWLPSSGVTYVAGLH